MGIMVLSLILFFNFDVKIFLIAFLAVYKLTENLLIIYFHLKIVNSNHNNQAFCSNFIL